MGDIFLKGGSSLNSSLERKKRGPEKGKRGPSSKGQNIVLLAKIFYFSLGIWLVIRVSEPTMTTCFGGG